MPDLRSLPRTRYGGIQTSSRRKSGTISKTGYRFSPGPWIPAFSGMTILIEMAVYKQTLISRKGPLSEIGIFVDFGSTFTKAVAIDLYEERIIGQGRSASTVTTDIMTGLMFALEKLEATSQRKCVEKSSIRLACSSAAG